VYASEWTQRASGVALTRAVRRVGEQHVGEDLGGIPLALDWRIQREDWMVRSALLPARIHAADRQVLAHCEDRQVPAVG